MSDTRIRYRHFFRCRACGHRFHVERLTADPARVKTPRCPLRRCASKRVKESYVADQGLDVGAGRAPAITGAIPVRALDMAMEVGAYNSGLTDLNDRPRYGENSAPKLPPNLQAMADSFFPDPKRLQQNRRRGRVDLSNILGGRPPGPVQQTAPAIRVPTDAALGPIHAAGEAKRPPTVFLNPPGT